MEDYYAFEEYGGITIGLVCDGHSGKDTSELLSKLAPAKLIKDFPKTSNIKKAEYIRDKLLDIGNSLKNNNSGSTLTGFLSDGNYLFIFNVGDSQTLVKTNGDIFYFLQPVFEKGEYKNYTQFKTSKPRLFQTILHSPINFFEEKRILDAGGTIMNNRLNGLLALTRAFGDKEIGLGLSYVPDIYWTNIDNVVGPIISYSDGVYEPLLTNRRIYGFEPENLFEVGSKSAKELVNYSYKYGSTDNITVLVSALPDRV